MLAYLFKSCVHSSCITYVNCAWNEKGNWIFFWIFFLKKLSFCDVAKCHITFFWRGTMPHVRKYWRVALPHVATLLGWTQLARSTPPTPLFFFPFFSSPTPSFSPAPALFLSPAPHSSPAALVTLLLRRPPLSRRRPPKPSRPSSCIYIIYI